MVLHCDSCERELGSYLYGPGGIEERAHILGPLEGSRIPDIICIDCWNKGYDAKYPKKRLEVKRHE